MDDAQALATLGALAFVAFKVLMATAKNVRWTPKYLFGASKKLANTGGIMAVLFGPMALAWDATLGGAISSLGGFYLKKRESGPSVQDIMIKGHSSKLASHSHTIKSMKKKVNSIDAEVSKMTNNYAKLQKDPLFQVEYPTKRQVQHGYRAAKSYK